MQVPWASGYCLLGSAQRFYRLKTCFLPERVYYLNILTSSTLLFLGMKTNFLGSDVDAELWIALSLYLRPALIQSLSIDSVVEGCICDIDRSLNSTFDHFPLVQF